MKDIFKQKFEATFSLNGKPAKASAEFERCCMKAYDFAAECSNDGIIDAWNRLSDIGNIDTNAEEYYMEGYDTIVRTIATKMLQELTGDKTIAFTGHTITIEPQNGKIHFHLVTVKKE